MNDLLSLIDKYQLITGVLLGWLFTRFGDQVQKPNIKMSVGHEALWPSENNPKTKFLHVKVVNKKRNVLKAIFFGNPTANNARAWISFLDFETETELLKINGRWVTKREPVDYSNNTVDPGEALIPPREVIPAGEESSLSIALKDDGERDAFAFNNESYLDGWRKKDYKLEEKRYLLRVKVSAEGKEWTQDFVLLNLGKIFRNFKIFAR